ncbi:hypothetical protein M9458_034366, partial [Cirrhinus mrigala]
DAVQTSSRPSKEVHPQPQTPEHQTQRPRRSLPTVPLTSPTTTPSKDITTPTKSKSRSYMSPTTSSMAKMSRSASMGDNLNVVEPEDTGPSDLRQGSSSDSSNPRSASQSKPTTPVSQISSPNTSASPFPGPYMPHAAVIPTLCAGSTGNSSSKGSARPLLHIDIPNPLPDKPLLSSLSPSTKTPKLVQKEKESSSRTPTTPSSHPGTVHLSNSIVQPVTAVCLSPSETSDQIEFSMVLVPSQTKNLKEDELHSHTGQRKEDTSETECPPDLKTQVCWDISLPSFHLLFCYDLGCLNTSLPKGSGLSHLPPPLHLSSLLHPLHPLTITTCR